MDTRRYIYNELKNIGLEEYEIGAEINFILENCFKVKNPYANITLDENSINSINKIIVERAKGVPLQYILGIANFMGKKFIVNDSTLIPRPETEILVHKSIEIAKYFRQPSVLDIGTGSGCIAITIASSIPTSMVSSCDISEAAINVATKNANLQKVKVNFIKSNLFENIENKFDIIVSNPPYIPENQKNTLQKEVKFEPESALFTTDENGTEFYEKIIKEAKNYLNNNGYILFELGIHQSDIVKRIFVDYNYSQIEIIKDLDGIERVILAKVHS